MFPIRDHNPSGSLPVLTLALIALNVAVFLASFASQSEAAIVHNLTTWGLVPARLLAGQGYAALVTHMFLHGSWLHLGGNMLFLWIFGDNLEDRLGRTGFLMFYLGAGLAAAGAQVLVQPASPLPMVGASGAIAGVLGGYIWLFPRARVDVLVIVVIFWRIVAMPAWMILGIWFLTQAVAGAVMPADAGGVAYLAHVGGFLAGLAMAIAIFGRRPPPQAADLSSLAPRQGTIVPLVRRRR